MALPHATAMSRTLKPQKSGSWHSWALKSVVTMQALTLLEGALVACSRLLLNDVLCCSIAVDGL